MSRHEENLKTLATMFENIDRYIHVGLLPDNSRQVIALVYETNKRKLDPTIDALLLMANDGPTPCVQSDTVRSLIVLSQHKAGRGPRFAIQSN